MDTGVLKPAISDQLMKRIAWRLAPLMILMYIANQLDRANIGYGFGLQGRNYLLGFQLV